VLILLPPSEGKTVPRRGRPLDLTALRFPSLTEARERVLGALVALCRADPDRAATTLDVPASQRAWVERNAELATAPTARADRVYAGVLYEALDAATLTSGAKRRLGVRVAVTSSLFGLVAPADRIPAYRLSGDAVLPEVGNVAALWREHLGKAVSEAGGDGLLVDLRSTMYAAFWRPPPELASRVVTMRVLHEVDGQRKVVSHFNKATKGRIVRALLESGATPRTPGQLANVLTELGWTVETSAPSRKGTAVDVVVTQL
jgi:uncharacterized protein